MLQCLVDEYELINKNVQNDGNNEDFQLSYYSLVLVVKDYLSFYVNH